MPTMVKGHHLDELSNVCVGTIIAMPILWSWEGHFPPGVLYVTSWVPPTASTFVLRHLGCPGSGHRHSASEPQIKTLVVLVVGWVALWRPFQTEQHVQNWGGGQMICHNESRSFGSRLLSPSPSSQDSSTSL